MSYSIEILRAICSNLSVTQQRRNNQLRHIKKEETIAQYLRSSYAEWLGANRTFYNRPTVHRSSSLQQRISPLTALYGLWAQPTRPCCHLLLFYTAQRSAHSRCRRQRVRNFRSQTRPTQRNHGI